jgi:hypothetical protein
VGTVQDAADQLAASTRDKGLILTLLPAETEQNLQASAQEVASVFAEIKGVVTAAREFVQAIDRLPFVNLPKPDPERVQDIEASLDSVRSDVEQIANDVRQFREDAAADISKVSNVAVGIDNELSAAQDDLAALDERLAEMQSNAEGLKRRVRFWLTLAAVLLTLLFAWVIYTLVVHILRAWADFRA